MEQFAHMFEEEVIDATAQFLDFLMTGKQQSWQPRKDEQLVFLHAKPGPAERMPIYLRYPAMVSEEHLVARIRKLVDQVHHSAIERVTMTSTHCSHTSHLNCASLDAIGMIYVISISIKRNRHSQTCMHLQCGGRVCRT